MKWTWISIVLGASTWACSWFVVRHLERGEAAASAPVAAVPTPTLAAPTVADASWPAPAVAPAAGNPLDLAVPTVEDVQALRALVLPAPPADLRPGSPTGQPTGEGTPAFDVFSRAGPRHWNAPAAVVSP